MGHSIHHKRHIGFGPANILRGLIFAVAVHLITGSIGSPLMFLGFYLLYIVVGQLLGLEVME
ncbi:MAG: hypothetical protein V1875_00745 [Candidatus Altiarchaeota archaeon]